MTKAEVFVLQEQLILLSKENEHLKTKLLRRESQIIKVEIEKESELYHSQGEASIQIDSDLKAGRGMYVTEVRKVEAKTEFENLSARTKKIEEQVKRELELLREDCR